MAECTGTDLTELWESYKRMVYPHTVLDDVQERELKRAFFAGAAGLFGLFGTSLEKPLSRKDLVRRVKAWRAELMRFKSETVFNQIAEDAGEVGHG